MDFSRRATHLQEQMDDPEADETLLFNTFAQFDRVNRLLANWSSVFRLHMLPFMREAKRPIQVLDIGGGGGDVMRHLHKLAQARGMELHSKIIDPDDRARRFHEQHHGISSTYEAVHLQTIVDRGETYDFVLSNHVLHHLEDDDVHALCLAAAQAARHKVIFNDIHRQRLAYTLFTTTMPLLFRNSFVVEDGGLSIQRSFTPLELRAVVPDGWRVDTLFPFRLLAIYEH